MLIMMPLVVMGVSGSSDGTAQALASCLTDASNAGGSEGLNTGPDSSRTGRYINLPMRDADQAPGIDVSSLEAGPWKYPVPPPLNLGSRFGQTGSHWSKGHTGVDFSKPQGTPIYAAASGIVLHTQPMGEGSGSPAYGNYVLLLHADNVVTLYAHMSQIGDIRKGQKISAGDRIGSVGSTGNSTGAHLHFEVRPAIKGRHLPVDPEPYLSNAAAVAPDEDPDASVGQVIGCTIGGGAGGGIDAAALPPLARKMSATVARLQSTICPELPQVWVYAEVMAESSWNPRAWTYDTNGGAGGLYQMGRPAWISATGGPDGWPAGAKPFDSHPVFKPETNLKAGMTYACGNLRQMTRYLAAHPEKTVSPLDAMAVCHIAGCSRVTGSATGIPTAGEAGCGTLCAHQVKTYMGNIHKYVAAFGASGTAGLGKAGPIPVAVTLPRAPAPYKGGSSGCTRPDPTGGRCLTGAAAHGYAETLKAFPRWAGSNCQAPRGEGGEHPLGRACDHFPGPAGQRAAAGQLAQGWALAGWLRTHAEALDVWYIIWQGRIWSVTRPGDQDGGWGRRYDNGLNDASTVTGGHYDHVHVSYKS
ncbi:peptidoglycan DD-metalloendopeptidase family protein [Streptomyces parvus]|uniref:peptidoglycan DD-metalloendopeptidase family protein n=1 Tax=Streptomyces parvus TaxID=66428 RepID=UPI003686BF15